VADATVMPAATVIGARPITLAWRADRASVHPKPSPGQSPT